MTTETVKFLGLTNPMLRECIDNLINTTIALQNSINVIFGNLANWQATVKPSLPPAPRYLREEVTCNTDDMVNDKYFKNAVTTIEDIKAAAFKAQMQQKQQEAVTEVVQTAPQKDYDPTVLLEEKKYIINESA